MIITSVKSFLLNIPIGKTISDSMQAVERLEFVGVHITTDTGIVGTGYTITVGFGGSVIQEVIDSLYCRELMGKNPRHVKEIWQQLYFGNAHWIGRSGATTMAQAAIDIALWDILAKDAEVPLWHLLGGAKQDSIPIYNTHAGWLNLSVKQLVEECQQLVESGYKALKIKVGSDQLKTDCRRIESVRRAIGDDVLLMVDANQKWDLSQAKKAAKQFAEFDLTWLEEPLHPDDVKSHQRLCEVSTIPIALGEHIYSTHMFTDYIDRHAVDLIQVDVCRIGGITPWLEVAAMAKSADIRVCPHAGDLMQVHQHLVKAITNSWYLEVIPLWETGPFKSQIQLENGYFISPTEPGASTDFTQEAFEQFRIK